MTVCKCSRCGTSSEPLEQRRTFGRREWLCISRAACQRRADERERVRALSGTDKASEVLYLGERW